MHSVNRSELFAKPEVKRAISEIREGQRGRHTLVLEDAGGDGRVSSSTIIGIPTDEKVFERNRPRMQVKRKVGARKPKGTDLGEWRTLVDLRGKRDTAAKSLLKDV